MALFGKKQVPATRPSTTLNGRRVTDPKVIGSPTRRVRLLGESVRRLSDHPLSQPTEAGVPIGDGAGMEALVALIRPVFAGDASMMRWVANRGALAFLNAQYLESSEGRAAGEMSLWRVMGIDVRPTDEGGLEPIAYEPPGSPPLSSDTRNAIVGLFVSIDARLEHYARFEDMSIPALTADPLFAISPVVALDYIAWSAVTALRDEVAENLMALPEPSGFAGPGWYTEPVFAKSERYWDGDWTERCRTPGRPDESALALV